MTICGPLTPAHKKWAEIYISGGINEHFCPPKDVIALFGCCWCRRCSLIGTSQTQAGYHKSESTEVTVRQGMGQNCESELTLPVFVPGVQLLLISGTSLLIHTSAGYV